MPDNKTISTEDVAHMAQLSRLAVSAQEGQMFSRQFAAIVEYMDILAEVDVTGVEPLYSPQEHPASLREDVARQRRSHKEVLANAPESDGQYFVVPKIV